MLASYILEQAFRQLRLPEHTLRQFAIATSLSDVGGKGFPRELFSLSAPVVIRGLLNYAIFQMRSQWIYPMWVHRQLDPQDPSFTARSQNPLFINITHRNWTLLGSPHGRHEAIVDPRGLSTPLPREWSIDVWIYTDKGPYYPSLSSNVRQSFDVASPTLRTFHEAHGLEMIQEHFVGTTKNKLDILFQEIALRNPTSSVRTGAVAVAVRPFNSEGVAPIQRVAVDGRRCIVVDGLLGVIFSEEPAAIILSNGQRGDAAYHLEQHTWQYTDTVLEAPLITSENCATGLAHAVAVFPFTLDPGDRRLIHCSAALGEESMLRSSSARRTWRVSYSGRLEKHHEVWRAEQSAGAQWTFGNNVLQNILEANRLVLLQLCDGDFISPGPFLYHRFWFRDAVPMCRALDVLGYHQRVRSVLNSFKKLLTPEGFYQGPDGEWDSNGAVLWIMLEHFHITQGTIWLRGQYPALRKAGLWIIDQRLRTRKTSRTHSGLLPQGLSAEHFGTVDQYYWDSFHGLAGLKSLISIAEECGKNDDARRFQEESRLFEDDIRSSLNEVKTRLGVPYIPASPSRMFDESAVGSVCGVYPFNIHTVDADAFASTVRELNKRYVRERGFYHPIIHSGYNMYLTMQIAHALLRLGDWNAAWQTADIVFRLSAPPYSLPEAIHPRTMGGSMGDGHHGWAAAEIVLFLRDVIIDDTTDVLKLFEGGCERLLKKDPCFELERCPTTFGQTTAALSKDREGTYHFSFTPQWHSKAKPREVELHLPCSVRRILPTSPDHFLGSTTTARGSVLRFSSDVRSAFLQM